MNPREFCRERGYTSAVALTYSFNPTFFEKLVLPDMWYGGTGEIVIVADQRQLEDGLQHSAGQLRYLGNGYHLTSGNRAAFHPKVLLRVGPTGAYLWLGSGNITHGGWGGNHELSVAWKLDGEDPLSRSIVAGLLDQIITYCGSENAADAVRRIGDRSWIAGVSAEKPDSPILMSTPGRTLADDLAERWRGRRFTSLRVFTGSSDRDGRFVKWCHDTFGIERCLVTVDPRTAAFDPAALESLPVQVQIEPAPSSPYLHAKFYWFEGPDGCAAVVGSANCSTAAWLLAPNHGGNVEAVFVYDDADEKQFSAMLGRFSGKGVKPSEVLGLGQRKEDDDETTDAASYQLAELVLHASQGRLTVRVCDAAPAGAMMSLRFRDETFVLGESDGKQIEWEAPCPEEYGEGLTVFGQLVVEINGQTHVSPPRWVDDQDRLRQAARRGGFGRISDRLKSGRTNSERNAFLEEFQLITRSLFAEPGAFPDATPDRKKRLPEKEARTVQPSDLIRHLAEIEAKPQVLAQHDGMPSFTLYGIMRELFGADEEEHSARQDPELRDDDGSHESSETESSDDVDDRYDAAPPTDRQKQRIKKMMDTFLEKLGEEQFAKKCSASQLAQAISLPLLLASRGNDHGWFEPRDVQHWILLTVDRLFRVEGSTGEARGLINIVRGRFEADGRLDIFSQEVGDGTLWLALINAIGGMEWDTTTGAIERALTMREVLRCQELVASADVGRLGMLVPRLRSVSERKAILENAAKVDVTIGNIESFLQKHFKVLTGRQVGGEHAKGDVVWRSSGWGFVSGPASISPTKNVLVYWRSQGQKAKMKAAGFFVNVTKAGARFSDLKKMLAELQGIFETENNS